MHIETVYCSTYSPDRPLTGHADIAHDSTKVKITFDEALCKTIQDLVVAAFLRERDKIAANLLAHTPALTALPSPNPNISDAEYFAIIEDTSDQVSF